MFKKNCSSLRQRYKKLVLVLTNKRGRKIAHPHILTTNSYPHQNRLKIGPKDSVFPIKQIKRIKCRPVRHIHPESGESVTKY